MRRNSSFSILFLAIFLVSSKIVSANDQTVKSVTINHSKEKKINIPAESKTTDPAVPVVPVTKTEEHSKKPHILKDELAHIHHFHKERVKKLKRHHKKYWMLSKLLLILSHIVLLICAYLHLAH